MNVDAAFGLGWLHAAGVAGRAAWSPPLTRSETTEGENERLVLETGGAAVEISLALRDRGMLGSRRVDQLRVETESK